MSQFLRDPREFRSFDEAERWSYRSMKELESAVINRNIPDRAFHLAREDVMRTVEEAEKYFRGYKYKTVGPAAGSISNAIPSSPNLNYSEKDLAKLPVEQSFGELTAFRVWRVTDKPELKSSYQQTLWPVAQIMKAHILPAENVQSGLYGWKSVFELVEYSRNIQASARGNWDHERNQPHEVPVLCIGRVHLWGEVIEHERGYRAEFARIISLDDCIDENGKWDGEGLQRMRELYFPKEQSK